MITKKQKEVSTMSETKKKVSAASRLDAIGWALFFIWVGYTYLADVEKGVGLLGVGIIVLGMQAVRTLFKLKLEGFWMVIGTLFAVGGLWEIYQVKLPLLPILLIVAGAALLVSAFRRKTLKFKMPDCGGGKCC
jgi:hypothetical protein